ncbi:MAG: site-2 protease family protein [Sulfolobales archaeon]|nr:site-2 protease family protein [Sulfolobales archaeon]MCX8208294.1 site-2 protease family protein [Sulfolobales archaeon]MDW8009992.1 site-2 protease family protein [Sulfolobales archaeon]
MREEVERVLARYASVEITYESHSFLEYVVTSGSIERYFDEVFRELVGLGYQPLLTIRSGQEIVRVIRVGVGELRKTVYYALAVATFAAVAATGYFSSISFYECLGGDLSGVPASVATFTLSVLVPLALHELGHSVTSTRAGIPTPLPLFIPAPVVSPLGTFGAVITTRFLPRDRKSLALLGLSGPSVGVAVSFMALLISMRLSPVVRLGELMCEDVSPIGFVPMAMYLLLLTDFIPRVEDAIILLHPAALASMLLLLIHFANLMPVGQLDGGHVVRSLTTVEVHRAVSLAIPALFIALSIFSPAYRWLSFFSILALLISGFRPHIGYSNQVSRLSARDRVLLLSAYLLLLVATVPVPL